VSARGIFDLRLWVEGEDEFQVWQRVTELQRAAELFAGPGIRIRYVQLRDGSKTRDFDATMGRKRGRAA
jgi:hypothetical protein